MTLFGAPNYCGEFDNAAATMIVSDDLTCSFTILQVTALLLLPNDNLVGVHVVRIYEWIRCGFMAFSIEVQSY